LNYEELEQGDKGTKKE